MPGAVSAGVADGPLARREGTGVVLPALPGAHLVGGDVVVDEHDPVALAERDLVRVGALGSEVDLAGGGLARRLHEQRGEGGEDEDQTGSQGTGPGHAAIVGRRRRLAGWQ